MAQRTFQAVDPIEVANNTGYPPIGLPHPLQRRCQPKFESESLFFPILYASGQTAEWDEGVFSERDGTQHVP
jgi:hypothetical protein